MSDLGAIFHVKKSGTQYDAHAYTTTDECPEPNLKIKFNDSPAYIKLEAKGSGDVPCYIKKSDGGVYQVRKEAISTGSMTVQNETDVTFTVPTGIKVIKVEYTTVLNEHIKTNYIGVTPGATHSLIWVRAQFKTKKLTCTTHSIDWTAITLKNVALSWSPQINKQTPTITDY